MRNYTPLVNGCVNFPIGSDVYDNTQVGGMVVKLVAVDTNNFSCCTGSFTADVLLETIVGDDVLTENETEYHFPHINAVGCHTFTSRPYLCAIVLGTTNWSGTHWASGEYWRCTYDDLTEAGKQLYQAIGKLYDGNSLHIVTYLCREQITEK